ncbi:uncharacterized protein Bfra_000749 [Botrytis fragariae]|uniref:Uncharacterized protein n=1 Tax=Botrytis fragariae TaxID=1964551 RepID=A0A8H6END1_9HELO|nr:uncharacterized protein Bfra_000749 [Botrytis fragariae]KAF5878582.1 hypothetical protein Bfra_000749 [Botrytis fragariae]
MSNSRYKKIKFYCPRSSPSMHGMVSKGNTYVVIVDKNTQTYPPTCNSEACLLSDLLTNPNKSESPWPSSIPLLHQGPRVHQKEERKCSGPEIFVGGYQLAHTFRSLASSGRYDIGA